MMTPPPARERMPSGANLGRTGRGFWAMAVLVSIVSFLVTVAIHLDLPNKTREESLTSVKLALSETKQTIERIIVFLTEQFNVVKALVIEKRDQLSA